ncbi:hypothetical protein [Synechococcus sp. PCC 6312]|uniref:hypothetical protein n=1 Tax=Synechococcus sp. (strain ATCC 27167 / PCC 6312) TaxID=195253 RepID=UPI00029ED147|nr:hypothetical protein [Synechococcus sp. PCC 6312]AFY61209.1 hypothetical protein Syn6312_2084 [Synechococcus sp. PCC 6312]
MMQAKFVTTPDLIKVVPLGKTKLQQLRDEGIFAEGLHWVRIPGPNPRKILWNLPLIEDFLATGGGPAHQVAIDNYLASLPSNQAWKGKGGLKAA